jgi:hypothetical protein
MISMSSLRVRRVAWPLAVLGAAILLSPAIASAAPGVFTSSSTTTPAVTATNSTTGLAINASSMGTVIRASSTGTTNGTGLFLRQFSATDNANGLYAKSYATSGNHYGAWGVNVSPEGAGVRGEATNGNGGDGVLGTAASDGGFGVFGASPGLGVVGSGGIFGVLSAGDFGNTGNVYDLSDGGWAGTCTVSTTATSCAFNTPFLDPTVAPVVVVTPQGNPGSFFWVSGANATGFTLNLASAPSGSVTFGYQVVGTFSTGGQRSSEKAGAAKAAGARAAAHN